MTLINSPINQQTCTYMQNGFRTDINKTSFPLGLGVPQSPINFYTVNPISNPPIYTNVGNLNNWAAPVTGFLVAPWNTPRAGSIPLNTVAGNNFQFTATNPATNITSLYNGITLDVPRCICFYVANSVDVNPFKPILDAQATTATNTVIVSILGLDYRDVLTYEKLTIAPLTLNGGVWGGNGSCDDYPCYFSNKAYKAILDISFNQAITAAAIQGSTLYIGVGISNSLGLPFYVRSSGNMIGNITGPYTDADSAESFCETNFANTQSSNGVTSINADLFLPGLDFYNSSPRDNALAAHDPYGPNQAIGYDARGIISFIMNNNETPFQAVTPSFFATFCMYAYGADSQLAAQLANEAVPTSVNIIAGNRFKTAGAYGVAHTGVYPTANAKWNNQLQLTNYDLVGVQYPGDYPDFLRVKPAG